METKEGNKAEPKLTCFANIKEEQPDWLIKGFIPKGEITLLYGPRGCGKTEFWCRLAAGVSSGNTTCFSRIQIICDGPQKVLCLSSNELTERDILPQLKKAKANLNNIFTVDIHDECFSQLKIEGNDNDLLKLIEKIEPQLLVLEPYQFFMYPNTEKNISRDESLIWNRIASFRKIIKKHHVAALLVYRDKEKPEDHDDGLEDQFLPDMWDVAASVLEYGDDVFHGGKSITQKKRALGELSRLIEA